MARAWAAVLWQEIIDGSRVTTRSAGIPVEADIGILFFFSFSYPRNSTPGGNERLAIRNLGRVCFEQLLIGRCDVRHGSWGSRNLARRRWGAQGAISRQSRFCSQCDFTVH